MNPADGQPEQFIDLDDPDIAMERLEVNAPPLATPHEMTLLFLQLILLQTIEDRAVAVNLFHDVEDGCLRIVEYRRQKGGPGFDWYELLPAPGYFAAQVLAELCRRIGNGRDVTKGTLYVRHLSRYIGLAADIPDGREVRLYFGDDRPPMRTKGKGQL